MKLNDIKDNPISAITFPLPVHTIIITVNPHLARVHYVNVWVPFLLATLYSIMFLYTIYQPISLLQAFKLFFHFSLKTEL